MIDDVVLLMNRDAWYAGKPRSNGFMLCRHKKKHLRRREVLFCTAGFGGRGNLNPPYSLLIIIMNICFLF